MKLLCGILALCVAGLWAQSASAAKPEDGAAPTTGEVRAAIERSLPFLEREGVAWMRDKGCVTCHQVPAMVWSLGEARRRKFPVNEQKLAQWNEWAVANALKQSVYYKLTDESFASLAEAGLSDETIAKLRPLSNKNFVFEEDYRAALDEQLSGEWKPHEAALLKAAAKTGQGGSGGGDNNQHATILNTGAAREVRDSVKVQQELVLRLAKAQKENGSWPAAGQFRQQQRSVDETLAVATLWSVLALLDVPELSAEGAQAMKRAREFLKTAPPETSVEMLLLRAMLAQRDGDSATTDELGDELLRLQHADGGWGWLKARSESDPFTTGQVLYGLSYLGLDGSQPAVRRAAQYLLQAQSADGAWPISMRLISSQKKEDTKAGDAIYTYWSTGWAALGLLRTLPE